MARALLLLPCLLACSGPPAPPSVHFSGPIMGTTWNATIVAPASSSTELRSAVEGALQAVDACMSPWKPNSDLSRFNALGAHEPLRVDPRLFALLSLSLEVQRLTGGVFDPTVGPLVDLWGFGPPEPPQSAPTQDALAAALALVGLDRLIRLHPETHALEKTKAGVRLDLSAIAKGHAVDRAAEALHALGFNDFLVEVGGELFVSGSRPGGGPWRIVLEKALPGPPSPLVRLLLTDMALATSGDYRNRRALPDGSTVHHVLDPRTGLPTPTTVAAASVLAPTCALADALATALMVLGSEGLALIESLASVEALLQLREGQTLRLVRSSGFARYEANS